MRRTATRIGLVGLLVLAWLVAIVGTRAVAAAPPAATTAQVRVVHAALNVDPVNVAANNQPLFNEVAYKQVSALVSLPTGQQSLKLTMGEDAQAVLDVPLMLAEGQTYTVLVVGTRSDISAKVLQDDLSPVPAGQARVRAVHASPDTPAADVALRGGAVLFANLGYTDSSHYQDFPASTVDLEVRPAGSKTVAASVPQFTIEAGRVYTVVAVGSSQGAPPLSALAVVDKVSTASTGNTGGTGTGAASTNTLPTTGVPGSDVGLLLAAIIVLLSGAMLRRFGRSTY